MFPSLKGFDLAIDFSARPLGQKIQLLFPSLKGFDLAIDRLRKQVTYSGIISFHPSKGSTSL